MRQPQVPCQGASFSLAVNHLSPKWLVCGHQQTPCHALEKPVKINLYLLCIHSILFHETAISLLNACP